jgi:hypothetical protein
MRSPRRWLVPLSLVTIGIILLIGCIPIPATRQLQPDGRPRPEWAVGTGKDKPVRLGQTTIEDAFNELSRRTGASVQTDFGWWTSEKSRVAPLWSVMNWSVSPDRRRFALCYQIRTTTWVMPLCFSLMPVAEKRWVTIDVNEGGIVTGATTSAQAPPGLANPQPDEWLTIFSEPQRRKLQATGVLPPDEVLRQAGEFARRRPVPVRPVPRPTTQ